MIVELHMLQNFAPSCLNRDDTNTPKDAEFGGHRRGRISSQCVKRSVRRQFKNAELLPPANLAIRTKRLLEEATKALANVSKNNDDAKRAVTAALAAGGLKVGDDGLTQYLLFLGRNEIGALVKVVADNFDSLSAAADKPVVEATTDDKGKRPAKRTAKQEKAEAKSSVPPEVIEAVGQLLDGGKAVDLALFGRMLADMPGKRVEAACQVAHALSTNRVSMEMDYFTAVDDLKTKAEDAGADMIGTVEFNSSCFYRYANIDTTQLTKNLGDDHELVVRAVAAFLRASIDAIPTGKQNSMAAQNPPSLVLAVVRKTGMWSLANAFVKPVAGDKDGLVANSIASLDAYWGQLTKMFGTPLGLAAAVATTEDSHLANLSGFNKDSVDAVIKTVIDQLEKEERS